MPDALHRLESIRARITAACRVSDRDPADVELVAVSKMQPSSAIRALYDCGHRSFGENYVQDLLPKAESLPDDIRWHFIGHLQRNKIRFILPHVAMIHGVDSLRLAAELDKQATAMGRRLDLLLQVNVSHEESKHGIDPSDALELTRGFKSFDAVALRGLMAIAADVDDPEVVRPQFRHLREIRDRCAEEYGAPLPHLSMGMTGDFEVAIEEGATLVRIGTALFGERNRP